MARNIKADRFYIITDVPKVYINFNKPNQEVLNNLKVSEARKYYEAGEFPPGSMGPKILAAIEFVEATGNEAIITSESEIEKENCGTRITLD